MTMRRFSYWEIMYLYRKADYVFLAIYPSHTHLQIAGTFRSIFCAEFAATSTLAHHLSQRRVRLCRGDGP